MRSLFERVVIESGLASVIATSVVTRACRRAGVAYPEQLTRVELIRMLPELEKTLSVFLSPHEVCERMADILKFTRSVSGTLSIDLADPALDE